MTEDDRWWKDDEDAGTSKEDVEKMLNEAEAKRLKREEELAQAEHEAKIAELERAEADARSGVPDEEPVAAPGTARGEARSREEAWMRDGFDSIEDWMLYEATKDGELTPEEQQDFIERAHGGFLGMWWLSPGEGLFVIIVALVTLVAGVSGIISYTNFEPWEETTGTILGDGDETGTAWYWDGPYEVEYCDDYGCNYWEEWECSADINYGYSVNGADYNAWELTDWETFDYPCIDEYVNVTYPIGAELSVYYNPDGPSESSLSEPTQFAAALFCLPILIIILIVALVYSRYSNTPSNSMGYTGNGFSGQQQTVIINNSGWRRWSGWGRWRGHHHPRHHHSSRRRIGGGGSRGGGRSGGGGGSRGGGRRGR
ncbi:MAG TPA: DUF3592 domain-containing protein [Candidatus Poseidoniales archaeon]|nr:DUF3592 domain-containing protein [Candidatus Poseidoniales archaeon]